ncbi:hypothetical protein ABH932_001399 [Streptacidiphilus sp. MAP5-52]
MAVAARHRYQLLLTLPPQHALYGSDALLRADMWFGNLMGWRKAMIAASGLLLIAWRELLTACRPPRAVEPDGP